MSQNFIFNDLFSSIGNILSYLNPFSENFFGKKIISDIGVLLRNLFIPSEQKLMSIHNIVSEKFSFVESIKLAINSLKNMFVNVNNVPSFTVQVPENRTGITEVKVIDLSWYAPYKPYGDLVFTAFIYILFLWRVYVHLPNILNGIAGTSDFVTDVRGGEHGSWFIKGQTSFFNKR